MESSPGTDDEAANIASSSEFLDFNGFSDIDCFRPKSIYKDPDDGRQRYPHCLFFLELLQNANFRTAMAHPGNKELAHRQQFYFWKNYKNNRLKHIVPRPLPEPVAAPQAPLPPPAPLPPTVNNMTGASAPVPLPVPPASQGLSPMQYGMPPGSVLTKNDSRSSGGKMLEGYITEGCCASFVSSSLMPVGSFAVVKNAVVDVFFHCSPLKNEEPYKLPI
ncbi:hypothetical protein RJ640_026198 [Escallonia rubra]|uniref:Mediator of RNA polymerase II transcription subunit 31 n=2 Tax=Magnoliopsida TaxID=3398 RepID=A0AA88SFG1_9ASTE|nr:hypothetical protein RJ640_026198 [Escallonia rubra]